MYASVCGTNENIGRRIGAYLEWFVNSPVYNLSEEWDIYLVEDPSVIRRNIPSIEEKTFLH